MEGYFTESDSVLVNKMGITDPDEMKRIETDVVALRMAEIWTKPPKGKMDFSYLRKIHRKLFGDLYHMAGKVRTVDMAKGDSMFCRAEYIPNVQQMLFAQAEKRFADQSFDPVLLASNLAWISSELNALHPFREGNGRAIRIFLVLLAQRYGYHMDIAAVDSQRRMAADMAAFQGDLKPLVQVYVEMLCASQADGNH